MGAVFRHHATCLSVVTRTLLLLPLSRPSLLVFALPRLPWLGFRKLPGWGQLPKAFTMLSKLIPIMVTVNLQPATDGLVFPKTL